MNVKCANRADHQYASGAVIFRMNGKNVEYLLLRAYNYWDCPKGQLEENEDFLETAKREVFEESNLKEITFVTKNKEKLYIETLPYGRRRKIARYYLCFVSFEESQKVKLKINPELGKAEHDEFRWEKYENAFNFFNDRMKKVLNWANKIVEEALEND